MAGTPGGRWWRRAVRRCSAQVADLPGAAARSPIHGLALCMILGVSQRFLPPSLAFRQREPAEAGWARRDRRGLLLESTSSSRSGSPATTAGQPGSTSGGFSWPWARSSRGVAVAAVAPAGPERSQREAHPAGVRLAGLSFLMLLLLPAYQARAEPPFSHAYYGAIRHAVTVGFVSQMIVGVSTLVVPLTPRTTTLRPTLVLLNLGCFLRVSLQICVGLDPCRLPGHRRERGARAAALLALGRRALAGTLGRVPRPAEAPVVHGEETDDRGSTAPDRAAGLQLALSTAAFAACFAVFGSLSAMMPDVRRLLHLDRLPEVAGASLFQSCSAASAGFPLGILADRLGGRLIFAFTLVASIVPGRRSWAWSPATRCSWSAASWWASPWRASRWVSRSSVPWYPAQSTGLRARGVRSRQHRPGHRLLRRPGRGRCLGYRWGFWAWGVLAAVVLAAWLLLARERPDADRRRGGPTTSGPWPGRVPGSCRSSTS